MSYRVYSTHYSQEECFAEGFCEMTGELYLTANFKYEDYLKWKEGTLIQTAFPYLSADDREFLISSLSPTAWKALCQE